MQTEAEAFLKRIRADPDEDAHRLIFADWLDEEGDPRGQFIRVQLALASLPVEHPERPRLLLAERDLLAAHRATWEAPLKKYATGPVFRRGFIDEVNVEAKQFLRHADDIFTASPVRHVHLLEIGDCIPAVLQSPYLSRLSALSVHGQHTGEPLARGVARSEHLAGLRRLVLTRNRFADDSAEQLAASVHLANLEELDLSENEIGETGARAIAASPHWSRLRKLEMRSNHLGPAGAEALAGSDRLTALHRLGLCDNDVGLPRLHSLSRSHDLLRVPVLDLSANGLNPAGLQVILTRPAGADPTAVRLTDLDLSHNTLGDDGARLLARCASLATLTALHLSNCVIGDEGARTLAASQHFNAVEMLDLENNPINDPGLRPFLTARHWSALRKLCPPRIGVSEWLRTQLANKFDRPARRG